MPENGTLTIQKKVWTAPRITSVVVRETEYGVGGGSVDGQDYVFGIGRVDTYS